jgi:Asp-tRNA(Asn)/Glu-tRNA(Gln) amidotransferase A subunit family amidase
LTSRAGVVPISHSQDTIGPHGKTVADAAAVLGALVGVDPRDPQTSASAGKFFTDYTRFLDKKGLKGTRIGVMRAGVSGYSEETDAVYEQALATIQAAGATLVPADLPTIDEINSGAAEITVLVFEFKRDLNAYLATRTGLPVHTLTDLIAFGLPVGLSFFGTAWSEPKLIKLASGFEAAANARKTPQFRTTLPTDGPRRRSNLKPKSRQLQRSPLIGHL